MKWSLATVAITVFPCESSAPHFAACEQLTPELWSLAGIADTGELGHDSSYLRARDFYVHRQTGFDYHKVSLTGAEPLYVAGNIADRTWPAATLHRIGKGSVIVGTPVWMNVKDDPTQMHGVFSEIRFITLERAHTRDPKQCN